MMEKVHSEQQEPYFFFKVSSKDTNVVENNNKITLALKY